MDNIIIELSASEVPPHSGKKAKQLVIFLHGFGSDGHDLISLASEYAEILPDAHFISPNAPFRCEGSPFGYQWFSLTEYNPQQMFDGACDAAPTLNHFIDKMLEKFDLKDENLALVGFSQGTMMSLHVSMRRSNACAGVIGHSGALLNHIPIQDELVSSPPVCLIHGVIDPVVPFKAMEYAVDALEEAGVGVEAHARPALMHGIDSQGIEIGKDFLKKVFD